MALSDFINSSQTLGGVLESSVNEVTGVLFLSLLIVIIFIMLVMVMFGVRLDYALIITIPVLIGLVAFLGGGFVPILVGVLLYLCVILAKIFIFQ